MSEVNNKTVQKIATREAYGKALAEFGAQYPNLVVLDADLANATKTNTCLLYTSPSPRDA